jgi:hypothetical protein
MNISPDEAAQALREIEASRQAMRLAIRNYRGHLHLWIWGCAWVIVSILNWRYEMGAIRPMLWVWGVAGACSLGIGFTQSNRIRTRVDRRFVAVCVALLLFGYAVWPPFFGGVHDYKGGFGYYTALWMQLYVVAGLWFGNCFLWIGIAVTALLLGSFLFAPFLFWASTLLCGLALIGGGFYVRCLWS